MEKITSSLGFLFSRATIKFVREAEDWRPIGQTVLRQEILFGIVAAGGLVALAHPLAQWLHSPALAGGFRLLAIDIPIFCAANAHQVILVGLGGFRRRALASMARWIVRLVLIIVLVELGFGLNGALLGLIGASVAELTVYRLYLRPPLFGRTRFPLRQMLGYLAPLFVFSMSMRLFDRTDLLLVTLPALGGSVERAGIYAVAQQGVEERFDRELNERHIALRRDQHADAHPTAHSAEESSPDASVGHEV